MENGRGLTPSGINLVIEKIVLSKPVINFNLGFSGSLLVAVESSGKITIFDLLKGDTINSFYFYEP